MKPIPLLLLCLMVASCNRTEQRVIPKYTIDQFYKNIRISGGNFKTDESKILIKQ